MKYKNNLAWLTFSFGFQKGCFVSYHAGFSVSVWGSLTFQFRESSSWDSYGVWKCLPVPVTVTAVWPHQPGVHLQQLWPPHLWGSGQHCQDHQQVSVAHFQWEVCEFPSCVLVDIHQSAFYVCSQKGDYLVRLLTSISQCFLLCLFTARWYLTNCWHVAQRCAIWLTVDKCHMIMSVSWCSMEKRQLDQLMHL